MLMHTQLRASRGFAAQLKNVQSRAVGQGMQRHVRADRSMQRR